jgi:GntR family transcriptional regulator/MocR family aminotransferase
VVGHNIHSCVIRYNHFVLAHPAMKRISTSFLPPVALDRKTKAPMYRQLYDWFRRSITAGQLRPGQRVPSTRHLAAELKISRIPVLGAYEQLLAEGYLESFRGAGSCVAKSFPEENSNSKPPSGKARARTQLAIKSRAPRKISKRAAALTRVPPQLWPNTLPAFRVNLPALDRFPINVWSKLVTKHSRSLAANAMGYGDSMGYEPFREAITEYLGVVRAVRCEPSQILVTTGSQQGLQISAQVLLDLKDRVWMEEPGYPGARQALATPGAELVPVPVDQEGLNVQEGVRLSGNARAVYITPSHQYPLGVTMSATRRMLLLSWATRFGAWIIEDDYDSEYRFGARPIASMQGLDANARVIYVGTFSKVMFPALRLGYVVVPKDLAHAFSATRDAADIFSPILYQAVMTDFIREGHFARHIRRMRMLYAERRTALVEALRENFGDALEVVGAEAGMHLVALLPSGISDVAIAKKAAAKGISAMPLSICYQKPPDRCGLVLGYGGADFKQICEGARTLATCF